MNNTQKICNKCKIAKDFTEFDKQKNGKYGLRGRCKKCMKIIKQKYYQENLDKFKKWEENRDKKRKLEYAKEYRNRPNYKKNKNEKRRKKYKTDNVYRLKQILRVSLKRSYDYSKEKKERTSKLLGCSYLHFYKWLKFNCDKDNLDINKIHIDHVYPLKNDIKNNNWKNLFPLTPEENMKKHTKMPSKKYIEKVNKRLNEFINKTL